MRLVTPDEMPKVEGLQTPERFYWVLKLPTPLAGMAYPDATTPWDRLHEHGFRRIVRLHEGTPYDPSPLTVSHAVALEDLYGGSLPQDEAREERLVREAVSAVLEELDRGNGIIVHCAGGVGRTGTVLTCTLKSLSVPISRIRDHFVALSEARGFSGGWLESPWQKGLLTRF